MFAAIPAQRPRTLVLALSLAALLQVSACARLASSASVSSALSLASSASSSELVSSPFRSSSRTKAEEPTGPYEEEIDGYITAALEAGIHDRQALLRGLSRLAASRGISDWEAQPATWTGVGRGLAHAALSEPAAVAWAESWAEGRTEIFELLLAGYAAIGP